ncbi:hypothetical protein J3E69DRAFT_368827 [Trichoderma sp. SZMC 28015]
MPRQNKRQTQLPGQKRISDFFGKADDKPADPPSGVKRAIVDEPTEPNKKQMTVSCSDTGEGSASKTIMSNNRRMNAFAELLETLGASGNSLVVGVWPPGAEEILEDEEEPEEEYNATEVATLKTPKTVVGHLSRALLGALMAALYRAINTICSLVEEYKPSRLTSTSTSASSSKGSKDKR